MFASDKIHFARNLPVRDLEIAKTFLKLFSGRLRETLLDEKVREKLNKLLQRNTIVSSVCDNIKGTRSWRCAPGRTIDAELICSRVRRRDGPR